MVPRATVTKEKPKSNFRAYAVKSDDGPTRNPISWSNTAMYCSMKKPNTETRNKIISGEETPLKKLDPEQAKAYSQFLPQLKAVEVLF